MPFGAVDYATLYVPIGASLTDVITWTQPNGSPVNLTGWTARAEIRQNNASGTLLLDMSTVNGRLTLGGTAGTITFNVAAGTTAGLASVAAVWSLELTSPSGIVTRLLEGPAILSAEVVH